jgi:hypothetical protein
MPKALGSITSTTTATPPKKNPRASGTQVSGFNTFYLSLLFFPYWPFSLTERGFSRWQKIWLYLLSDPSKKNALLALPSWNNSRERLWVLCLTSGPITIVRWKRGELLYLARPSTQGQHQTWAQESRVCSFLWEVTNQKAITNYCSRVTSHMMVFQSKWVD